VPQGFVLIPTEFRNIVPSAFTPVLAKHTKHLSLVDILAVGVDRMQRNFEPVRKPVEAWKGTHLPDETTKLVIHRAFVEGELDVPKHFARRTHKLYFNPQVAEFRQRTHPGDGTPEIRKKFENRIDFFFGELVVTALRQSGLGFRL
jgi:hypothetical protein